MEIPQKNNFSGYQVFGIAISYPIFG